MMVCSVKTAMKAFVSMVKRTNLSLKVALVAITLLTSVVLVVMMTTLLYLYNFETVRSLAILQLDGPMALLEHERSKSTDGPFRRTKERKASTNYLASRISQNGEDIGMESGRLDQHLQTSDEPGKTSLISLANSQMECKDVLCTEYLSESDLNHFHSCQQSSTRRYQRFLEHRYSSNGTARVRDTRPALAGGILATGNCRFMNGRGRGVVGLVSFPGSGNTWVRGLLQAATGICTGAVYCDAVLRHSGFDGEMVQSSSVLVVKSHSATPTWNKPSSHRDRGSNRSKVPFDSVILIIRNPFHALVSEWNRLLGTKYASQSNKTGLAHVESHGPESFGENHDWQHYVSSRINRWAGSFNWLVDRPQDRDALVVRYEDLVEDGEREVRRMLNFLHMEITDVELSRRLKEGVQQFHRAKRPEFEHYTPAQRAAINTVISRVRDTVVQSSGRSFGLEEYLWTSTSR